MYMVSVTGVVLRNGKVQEDGVEFRTRSNFGENVQSFFRNKHLAVSVP